MTNETNFPIILHQIRSQYITAALFSLYYQEFHKISWFKHAQSSFIEKKYPKSDHFHNKCANNLVFSTRTLNYQQKSKVGY